MFDPEGALRRGYAIVSKELKHITSVKQLKLGNQLDVRFHDGTIQAKVSGVGKGQSEHTYTKN
jgi:exonuclease VII large subunit